MDIYGIRFGLPCYSVTRKTGETLVRRKVLLVAYSARILYVIASSIRCEYFGPRIFLIRIFATGDPTRPLSLGPSLLSAPSPAFRPRGQGPIAPGLPCGICVGAGLDRPPVVPSRNDDRVDPVHDALVMRRTAERIRIRERVGLEDSFDDVLARDVLGPDGVLREHRPGARESPNREIRNDPQVDATARPLLDVRGDRLRHRVHRVGAHRVAAVDDEVGDDHVAPFRVHDSDLDVLGSAAGGASAIAATVLSPCCSFCWIVAPRFFGPVPASARDCALNAGMPGGGPCGMLLKNPTPTKLFTRAAGVGKCFPAIKASRDE